MTADEARALFSDAYDGELDTSQRAAFDAALSGDPTLSAEFEAFSAMLRGAPEALPGLPPPPDLLRGVQRRIRRGSRGRYYRDRFAERAGRGGIQPMWLALLMALVLLGMWLSASYLRLLPGDDDQGEAGSPNSQEAATDTVEKAPTLHQ